MVSVLTTVLKVKGLLQYRVIHDFLTINTQVYFKLQVILRITFTLLDCIFLFLFKLY